MTLTVITNIAVDLISIPNTLNNVVLMEGHRLRLWLNIKTTLGQSPMSAGLAGVGGGGGCSDLGRLARGRGVSPQPYPLSIKH